MKKKLLTLLLISALMVTVLACFTGCGIGGKTEKYAYKSAYANYLVDFETSDPQGTLEFIYEDTYLKLYDDGTWVIDMPIFLFINSNIDEGTYMVEDGTYYFDGFEYGMDAYGEKSEDGFEIYFLVREGKTYTKAMAIYFE